MKKIYTFLLFAFCFTLHAQESAYPAVEFTTLYNIVAEGDNITAVGSCDKVMYSNDGGDTWNTFNLDIDVYDIALIPNTDGKRILLLDRDVINILDISDESVVTTSVTSNSLVGGLFQRVEAANDKIVLVAAISIFQGDPSDLSFAKVGDMEYNSSDRIRDMSVTDNYAYVAMKEGKVFKADLNANTVDAAYEFDKEIRSMAMGTDDVGYVGFLSSDSPVKTTDGGASWTAFGSFSEVATLHAFGENVVISQNTNRLVVSTDGAQTSEYISYDPESQHSYLDNVFFDDSGKMYMCGQSNTILISEDFGVTHENLNPYPRASFTGIDINNNGVGIAVGGQAMLITTDDNGVSWTQMTVPSEYQEYMDGCLVTEAGVRYFFNDEGVMKIDNGEILRVSDESLRTLIYNDAEDYFLGFKNQGGSFVARKSVDGGATWENKTILNDFGYRMATNGMGMIMVSMNDQEYAISQDHGDTWEFVPHDFDNSIAAIALYEDKVALVTVGNVMYKSTDGLETFEPVSTGYGQWNTKIYDENHYIFTSAQNFITTVKETKDGGETWSIADSYCSQTFGSDLVGDRYWMGQRGGHLNYTTLDLSTHTSDLLKRELSIRNSIVQAGSDILITTEDMVNGRGVMYDQSGRIIRAFDVNTNEVMVNTKGMRPGVYFISINDNISLSSGKVVVVDF